MEGSSSRNRNWCQEKEVGLVDLIHSSARRRSGKQTGYEKNIEHSLLNERLCQRHNAGAFLLRRLQNGVRRVSVSG